MSEADLQKVTNGFTQPHGMILSTGPTGSGKSTSMYAILKIISTPDKNISTIEDPVEYDITGINQIQVNPATNLTFAEGLRSILRQDPDIIYVGEIRDNETAEIAINSALTGHLVLSTLHTNDAATALPRLIEMQIEPFLIASTVNVVIGQRLVRKICTSCKVSYTQSTRDLLQGIPDESIKKKLSDRAEVTLYKGKGCEICHNTGYSGRIGIFEILVVTDNIRKLISMKESSDIVKKKAIEEGMTTMMENGLEKILQGITSIEEVMRTTKE
jgi:type II secretory ATPase GspE/PulE/Tfp pilus assembly ATPase PilB-like protein